MTRPPRHFRRSYAALVVVIALLAGCGGNGSDDELVGLIVDVRGRGNNVTSFLLRTGDRTYNVRVDPDVDYGYQLGHLRVHETSLYPVRCTVERRQGKLYAVEIVDA